VQLDANLKALWDDVRFLRQRQVEGGTKVRTGEQRAHVVLMAKAWRVAEVRLVHHFQAESVGRVRTCELKAHADVVPKMLRVAAVHSHQHC
jgi:hypothetical protein